MNEASESRVALDHVENPDTFAGRRELLEQMAAAYGRRSGELLLDYWRRLPRPAVARCPHSNSVVHHSVDTGGLDGPWWNYRAIQRPPEEEPPTFFAFTGALRTGDPVPNIPWLVKPGPEAPYVVPRLLGLPGVRAVVRGLHVGGWDGWTITYFSDRSQAVERVNDWGALRYWVDGGRGVEWDSMIEDVEPLDFDLAPWIERGALQWIAPGDAEIGLHSTSAGCPYLGLPGRRAFVRVQDGITWDPASVLPTSGPSPPALGVPGGTVPPPPPAAPS